MKIISPLFLVISLCWLVAAEVFTPLARRDKLQLKEDIRRMFYHGYDNYKKYAHPHDELRPLSCSGFDTFGNYSLTLIDTLDMLVVMGNVSEFRWAIDWLATHLTFDYNLTVSVFETNIRILGGLLSAHIQAERLFGADYNGSLLPLCLDLGERLLLAFKTPTGLPYGSVNLKYGVPEGETTIVATAGAGSLILEFGVLSALSNEPKFHDAARHAMIKLWDLRDKATDLIGAHIDTASSAWTETTATVGSNVDSYFEYLLKGAIFFNDDELFAIFEAAYDTVNAKLKGSRFYVDLQIGNNKPIDENTAVINTLQAFWPGLQTLYGDVVAAQDLGLHFHSIWRRYGSLPERFNANSGEPSKAVGGSEQYHLRPELIESVYYLSRSINQDYWQLLGRDFVTSLRSTSRAKCGYASLSDIRRGTQIDRMESFFLSETTKYLYLMFDVDNYFNKENYLFTTEGHLLPIQARFQRHRSPSAEHKLPKRQQCPLVPHTVQWFEATNTSYLHGFFNAPLRPEAPAESTTAPAAAGSGVPVKVILFACDGTETELNLATTNMIVQPDPQDAASLVVVALDGRPVGGAAMALKREEAEVEPVVTRLEVVAPPSGQCPGSSALFGPQLSANKKLQGKLIVANPKLGCGNIQNGEQLRGRVAMVWRGQCYFSEKVAALQEHGVKAVVVVNNAGGTETFTMTPDDVTKVDITVPSMMIGQNDGDLLEKLVAQVPEGPIVSLTAMSATGDDDDKPADVNIMYQGKKITNILVRPTRKKIEAILAKCPDGPFATPLSMHQSSENDP